MSNLKEFALVGANSCRVDPIWKDFAPLRSIENKKPQKLLPFSRMVKNTHSTQLCKTLDISKTFCGLDMGEMFSKNINCVSSY